MEVKQPKKGAINNLNDPNVKKFWNDISKALNGKAPNYIPPIITSARNVELWEKILNKQNADRI